MFLLAAQAALAGGVVCAQGPPAGSAPVQKETSKNVAVPCVQPPPMVRLQDYDGPLKKVVGTFARPLERKAVPLPRYKLGVKLCTLNLKDKFALFLRDSFDPVTFLGAEFAGQAGSRFFKDFAYPSMFSEDPRYYRLAHGHTARRLLHAVEHAVVAHRDNGNRMFNFSEWLGTASTVVLSNTYHPDNQRGFAPAAQRVGYCVLQDMGFDVLREFWPEISRKLKLPFRGEPLPASHDSNPATQ